MRFRRNAEEKAAAAQIRQHGHQTEQGRKTRLAAFKRDMMAEDWRQIMKTERKAKEALAAEEAAKKAATQEVKKIW